jgi:hypothetical protein
MAANSYDDGSQSMCQNQEARVPMFDVVVIVVDDRRTNEQWRVVVGPAGDYYVHRHDTYYLYLGIRNPYSKYEVLEVQNYSNSAKQQFGA